MMRDSHSGKSAIDRPSGLRQASSAHVDNEGYNFLMEIGLFYMSHSDCR